MSDQTKDLLIILCAVVVLTAINLWASVLGVPLVTATIGDMLATLMALMAFLFRTKSP